MRVVWEGQLLHIVYCSYKLHCISIELVMMVNSSLCVRVVCTYESITML